jgi:hypothetical protein
MARQARPGLLMVSVVAACVAGFALWHARSAPRPPAAPAEADPPTPPRPAPATPRPVPKGTPPTRGDVAALDEARLMARLREAAAGDPELAVTLAREGNRRFPNSAAAPERTSILIHALAALGRGMEARGEAENMVNGYPDSPWVREIELFTGAHRHRNVRVNDAGVLEYYDPTPAPR